MQKVIKVYPSLLSASFTHLADEIRKLDQSSVDGIHFDIMDSHFVPNLTFGPMILRALRPLTKAIFDVHLMVTNVPLMIEEAIKAGADAVTFHIEATPHAYQHIALLQQHGVKAGIALNPGTPLAMIEPLLGIIHHVLIMTVNPGFPGQNFIETQLTKIMQLRKMIEASSLAVEIQVDGGINAITAPKVLAAGADTLIAGTAVFKGKFKEYHKNIALLKDCHRSQDH